MLIVIPIRLVYMTFQINKANKAIRCEIKFQEESRDPNSNV